MAAVFTQVATNGSVNRHWSPIPKTIPSAYWSEGYVFFLDELLQTHLAQAFSHPGNIGSIRLTRDGDFTVELEEEDPESIPDVVKSGIGRRERGRPARLQYAGSFSAGLDQDFLKRAASMLRLQDKQLFVAPKTLCLHGLWSIVNSQIPAEIASQPGLLHQPVFSSVPKHIRRREPEEIFDAIREQDLLLHHPYDSFDTFVSFIGAACKDPKVKSIELTLYRTDALSPVIGLLKKHGKEKQIRVLIELRARFDELNNLRLTEELRASGVEVGFGFGKLKLHAKIALVTREEEGELRHFSHFSTGNYNSITARQYTDLSILTAHPQLGSDARLFFDSVWEGKVPTSFKQLLSAPTRMHRRLLHHIEAETQAAREGKSARIVAKVNALVDETITESLYKASEMGVQVDLIVRGACSLIPGISGLSENIRVISIVDRFLEHSRIYYFEASQAMYLSSADWMPRNFFSRLELAYPVLDPRIFSYLRDFVIPTYLSDNVKARELTPQGLWKSKAAKNSAPPMRSQFHFEELAKNEYQGTPLSR